MTNRIPTIRDERLNGPFLRSIGCLSLAAFELEALQPRTAATDESVRSWAEFSAHLMDSAKAVMEGACGSALPGNTISILREGVRVAVDTAYLDRLTTKIQRHVKVGHAIGMDELLERSKELELTA